MDNPTLAELVLEYSADYGSLNRTHPFQYSSFRFQRLNKFYEDWQGKVNEVPDQQDSESQIDLALLTNLLAKERSRNLRTEKLISSSIRYIPGWEQSAEILNRHREKNFNFPHRDTAAELKLIADSLKEAIQLGSDQEIGKIEAYWAFKIIKELLTQLDKWNKFYDGYDPEFDWWMKKPYQAVKEGYEKYLTFLTPYFAKNDETAEDAIVGLPIGREGLLEELQFEWIAYTPEELIEIGKREFEWCEKELEKAASELGLLNGKAAIAHVKSLHEAPGKQPSLVKFLADEAVAYLEGKDLLTIPDLAKETWRISMMSAQAQKTSPFFLGGEQIIVSYPTAEMSQTEKLMSMQGNNRHFSRATVQHELIPGHHMQQFFEKRFHSYRRAFWTPFWVEGWTIYWELFLWQLGFPNSPEDRIGMLFWRMHRTMRIIFSLRFHLGEIDAQECIRLLVEEVGHEPANGEGEVRRSLSGAYPELYQAAYMLGGLQMKALGNELTNAGAMTRKQFHDQFLRENQMPIEGLRLLLKAQPIDRNHKPSWKFYQK